MTMGVFFSADFRRNKPPYLGDHIRIINFGDYNNMEKIIKEANA